MWIELTASSVCVTQASLGSYARLTLTTVWELTVAVMENVLDHTVQKVFLVSYYHHNPITLVMCAIFLSVPFLRGNDTGPIVGGVLGVFVALILILILVIVVVLIMRGRKRPGKDDQGRYNCPVISLGTGFLLYSVTCMCM